MSEQNSILPTNDQVERAARMLSDAEGRDYDGWRQFLASLSNDNVVANAQYLQYLRDKNQPESKRSAALESALQAWRME